MPALPQSRPAGNLGQQAWWRRRPPLCRLYPAARNSYRRARI